MAGRLNDRKHKITHLLYMDDLKLYVHNEMQNPNNPNCLPVFLKHRYQEEKRQLRDISHQARETAARRANGLR